MHDSVPNWPRLLSLTVHEFRTPVTVVAGYLRMLLRDRAGPLSPNQRRLLEEAEKSCGRLSGLLSELSELGQLHDGRQGLSEGAADLGSILQELAKTPAGDGQGAIIIDEAGEPLPVKGDAARLRRAIEAIVFALRREIIDGSTLVIAAGSRTRNGARVAWIVLGTEPIAAALKEASADALGPFDEWRGGCGLSLPLARRVVEMHGGRLLALTGERQKSGGVIELPLA